MKPLYKIILIIGLVLVVVLAIFLGWRKITTEAPVITTPPEFPEALGDKDAVLEKPLFELIRLSDDERRVFDFWENPRTKEVYYITSEGQIINAKPGPDPEVSLQNISALNFTKTSPDGKWALVAFGDPKSPQWGVFDIIDGVWRPLQLNAVYATWGETSDELIIITNTDKRTLNLVSLKDLLVGRGGVGDIILSNFLLRDVVFEWLPPGRLIITEKPASFYASRVWQLTLGTLELKLLMAPERGVVSLWSRYYDVVFKYASPDKFFILDRSMRNILPVFFTTLPQKCGVGPSLIYCFAPRSFPPDINDLQLPDDYFQKRFYTIDSFYTINRASNKISLILNSNTSSISAIDAEAVKVFGGKIYFINRYDQGLYRIILNPIP